MTDLRVRRTDRAIQDAFVKLVLARGFDSVTVSKIASEAMINRQTFYKHYTDKYDLAEKMSQQVTSAYETMLKERVALAKKNVSFISAFNTLLPDIRQLVATYRDQILVLRAIHLDRFDFNQSLRDHMSWAVSQILNQHPSEFEQAILDSLSIGMMNYVLKVGKLPSTDEIERSISHVLKLFA